MNFDCCLSGEVTYSINVLCNQGVPYSSFKNELAESVYDLQNILEWKALRTLDVSTLPVRHLVMERELCRGECWAASRVGQRDATECLGVRDNNEQGRLCHASH